MLNTEGVPSPTGITWGFSSVWSILHNDVYIGRRTWNKHDYVNFGKKKKPQSEWIVVADAHPPIVDRDTFNAVAAKGHERSPLGGAYQPTGPSLYILRGMMKCPLCGVNMVTGANSRKNRGHTRYYHCGTYHRKGSKACKRNSVSKEKIEAAVLTCLIREFSLLSFPGSLEDEVRRHVDNQNRDITFQLARIDDDIKHLNRRIEIARKEKISSDAKFAAHYIKEMEGEIEKLTRECSEVDKMKTSPNLTEEHLQLIRDRLKDFVQRIKIEPPDVQHNILKRYICSIVYDQFSKNFKLTYKIDIPDEASAGSIKVFEKTSYFMLN
jgi:site-specific DNA recombinase